MNERESEIAERVGAAIRDARDEIGAPQSLRASIVAARPAQQRRRPSVARWAGVGVALAAIVAALVLALGPNGSEPTVADAAKLGLARPNQRAPAITGRFVDVSLGSVRFPNYSYGLPLRASGARSDRLDGRPAETVFYTGTGQRVGYTVLGGSPLTVPASARQQTFRGIDAAIFRHDGAVVVTWRRSGKTCVLASKTAGRGTLLSMASWN